VRFILAPSTRKLPLIDRIACVTKSEISHSLIILDQSLVGNRESLESEASSNSNPHQWKKHVSVRPLLQSCSRAACTSMILCSYRQCKTCGLICHLDCAHALTEECGKAVRAKRYDGMMSGEQQEWRRESH